MNPTTPIKRKIAISARGLSYVAGGAKEYIRIMAEMLPKNDPQNHYYIYYASASDQLGISHTNVTEIVLPKTANLIWDHLVLPFYLKKHRIDLALFFKGTIPITTPCKALVSVLDMIYFFPGLETCEFFDRHYMKWSIPYSVKKADAVIAISNSTRMDILRFVPGVEENKISAVHLAAPKRDHEAVPANIRDIYNLGERPYIFLSSAIAPRKNIERTIKALKKVSGEIPHNFVVTGGSAWGNSRISETIEATGLQDRFKRIGFVEDPHLKLLYQQADLYVMPSLYEGFSLTILEAMQEGCPVIASNVSSHPEVVGDAGLLFDPYSSDEIADAILRVVTTDNLRETLIIKGLARAAEFSWENCVKGTLNIIHNVLQPPSANAR